MFRKATQPSQGSASKASITELAPCQKSVRLHVGQDVITPVRTEVFAEFQRNATLPGFRKGKAPADLIERQYHQSIQDETLHRVTKQAFEQAAKEHDLKPVGPFEVRKADFSATDGLTLEATVEVEPAFKLATYKGIALKQESADVTPSELQEALNKLQESMAQMVPVKEGEAKQRQVPPLDNELAKDLGFETLEKLSAHVGAKLREQKQSHQSQTLEAVLCEELLKRHTFEVPPRLVGHQTERLTRDFKVRLVLSGTSEDKLEEEVAKFTEQLRTSAERRVKLSFILDRIAEQESIAVAQHELVERLWQLSQRWKKDPVEVRKLFDAQQLWPSVVSAIRQEKTVAMLLAAAAIETVPATPAVMTSPAPATASSV